MWIFCTLSQVNNGADAAEKKYEVKGWFERKKEQYLAINAANDKNAENHFKAFRDHIDVALDYKSVEEGVMQ